MKLKFKILILTCSTLISLVVAEVFLRSIGFTIQRIRTNELISYKEKKEGYVFSLNKNLNIKNYKILTLGDSVTNGSNVEVFQSYPYVLSESLKSFETKMVEVLNYGYCERNSKEIAFEFRKAIEDTDGKIDMIILIGGAADAFNLIDDKLLTREDIFQNINTGKSKVEWVNNLKIYKMTRAFLLNWDRFYLKHFKIDWDEIDSVIEKYPVTRQSLELAKQGKLNESLEVLQVLKDDKLITVVFSKVIIEVMYNFLKDQKYVQNIEFTLNVLRLRPELLMNDTFFSADQKYLLYKLAMSYEVQSKINAEDIAKVFRELGVRLPALSRSDLYNKFLSVFVMQKENEVNIQSKRKHYFTILIKEAKLKNIKLILASYPVRFQKANEDLKALAKEFNVEFVDLEQVFIQELKKIKNRSELIEEDEHPTAKGYAIIANTFLPLVKSELSKMNKVNSKL